jgi:hypothetical protein
MLNYEEFISMHDYKKRYFELFNKVTDVIEMLSLIQAQTEQEIIADENNNEEELEQKSP